MTKPLVTGSKLCEAIGAEKLDVENWIKRGIAFESSIRPTVQGAPRYFDKDNAVEIGAVNALVQAGAQPAQAAAYAKAIVRAMKATRPPRRWMAFTGGDFRKGKWFDKISPETLCELVGMGGDSAPVLAFIDVGTLLKRINALFEGDD